MLFEVASVLICIVIIRYVTGLSIFQPFIAKMTTHKMDGNYWIKKLNLKPHPEGGYYREIYKNIETVTNLPDRYGENAERAFGTHIYFLLMENDIALFHRLKSDEIWNHVDGDPITIYIINKMNGKLEKHHLGKQEEQHFSTIVPAESFYSIGPKKARKNGYALVTTTVCPGFEFDDFELTEREHLMELYPQHKDIIYKFTPSDE